MKNIVTSRKPKIEFHLRSGKVVKVDTSGYEVDELAQTVSSMYNALRDNSIGVTKVAVKERGIKMFYNFRFSDIEYFTVEHL